MGRPVGPSRVRAAAAPVRPEDVVPTAPVRRTATAIGVGDVGAAVVAPLEAWLPLGAQVAARDAVPSSGMGPEAEAGTAGAPGETVGTEIILAGLEVGATPVQAAIVVARSSCRPTSSRRASPPTRALDAPGASPSPVCSLALA